MARTWQTWAALGLALLAFVLSGVVSRSVFERLPHLEDEVAYQFQAKVFARGVWMLPSPEPRRALWQPFVVDNSGSGQSMRFSKYTPGWSLTLAGGEALGQAWLVNAWLALLAVALVYRLGAEIFTPDVGLIAAVLLTFSPAALLLNGSLMGHTASLMETLLFIYALWRLEKAGRGRLGWALVAGVSLGALIVTRPASALAVAIPCVIWVGLFLLRRSDWTQRIRSAVPYVLLAVVALSFQGISLAYNAAATGNPRANLYTLVWGYDQPGFGECCGRSGHTLEKAFRHARFDLSLAAADLFGWQVNGWQGAALPDELRTQLLTEADYWQPTGMSFVLLPLGILIGALWGAGRSRWRRLAGVALWTAVAIAWCVLPVTTFTPDMLTSPAWGWGWVLAGMIWACVPVLLTSGIKAPQARMTWLLVAVVACIVIFQMTYWVGSQRYSTRYWYEAIGALCLLSALPIAGLMRSFLARVGLYAVLALLCVQAYTSYSIPRVSVLYGFNLVSQARLDELTARRVDNRPILLIVNGDAAGDNRVLWRAYSSMIAVTSPFLDSDIVAARVYTGETVMRAALLARFPDRQVIEMLSVGVESTYSSP